MNLRRIANNRTMRVNRNVSAVWRRSDGYETQDDGTRTPKFIETPISINPQPVATKLLRIEGLNIEGVKRSVYINTSQIMGVVRPDVRGGDYLVFPPCPGDINKNWKVIEVIETWPDWSHVIVVME
jgi:hypothetical protein